MPMYVYAIILPDGSEGESFEVLQGMNEPTLTQHPETGEPVKRLLSAPNVSRKGGGASPRGNLSNSNLERLGFTKYEKSSKGNYEKTVGSGPDAISDH